VSVFWGVIFESLTTDSRQCAALLTVAGIRGSTYLHSPARPSLLERNFAWWEKAYRMVIISASERTSRCHDFCVGTQCAFTSLTYRSSSKDHKARQVNKNVYTYKVEVCFLSFDIDKTREPEKSIAQKDCPLTAMFR